jgi:hypothetical protein
LRVHSTNCTRQRSLRKRLALYLFLFCLPHSNKLNEIPP